MSGSGRRNPNHQKGGRRPPSPPKLDDSHVQLDPRFIQQQPNAAPQYPPNYAYNQQHLEANVPAARYDEANPGRSRLYATSQSKTTYDSPNQHQLQITQYGTPGYQSQYHYPYHLGPGNQYEEIDNSIYGPSHGADYHPYPGIQHPQFEQHPGSAYYNHPGMMQPQYPVPLGYYTNSPPTPAASDQTGDRRRGKGSTRSTVPYEYTETPRVTPDDIPHSGRAQKRNSSETPVKPAKQTKNKKGKRDVPVITAPLSEVAKSYDIPLDDIDAYINRPVEKRLEEVKKRDGKIPRPMNAFMLYRKAYTEIAKRWADLNNHQMVSSITGESWRSEPAEIRARFKTYGELEQKNHAKAHPGYKFCPAKTDASQRKRKGATKEQDDDDSGGLDDLDFDWQPGRSDKNKRRNGRAKRVKTTHNSQRPASLDFQVEFEGHAPPEPSPIQQSNFEYTDPGTLPPHQFDSLQNGEYYQTIVDSNILGTDGIENAGFPKAETPHSNGESKGELVGLPGADHHELLLDPRLNGDNLNLEGNLDFFAPLDPHLDPLFEFDLDQLGELDGQIGETILRDLDPIGIFDMSESNAVHPQVTDSQDKDQNEAESEHRNSAQENPNEYENGYQSVDRDVYQNQRSEEVENEQSREFLKISEKRPILGNDRSTPREEPMELNPGKLDDEKLENGKFDEDRPGDEQPGDKNQLMRLADEAR